MKRTQHITALTGALSLLTTMTVGVFPVSAIPDSQERCRFDAVSTTVANGNSPISGLFVTVNNSTPNTQRAIVQLSADLGVETNAEVRISYSVDGNPPLVFGPTNFANHQEFFETRATMAIIPIPPGTHTITPFWRISGALGKSATVVGRCITAEINTR